MTDSPFDSVDWSVINKPDDEAAKASLAAAAGSDPDQTGRNISLSKQLDMPIDTVGRNPQDAEHQAALARLSQTDITREVPQATDWLADPHNAQLVSDDPSMISKLKNTLSQIPEAYAEGKDQNRLTDYYGRMFRGGQLSPDEENDRKALEDAGLGDFKSKDTYNSALTLAQMAPQMALQFGRGAQGAIAAGAAGAGAGAIVGSVVPGAGTLAGAAAVGGPAARAGFYAGDVYEGTRQMIDQTYGNILRITDANGNKIDPDIARGAAIMVGSLTGPMMAAGLDNALTRTPGAQMLRQMIAQDGIKAVLQNGGMRDAFAQIGKKMSGSITVAGLLGAGQQAIQIGGEELSKQVDNGNFKPITPSDALDRVWQGATTNMLIAGTMGVAGAPLELYRPSVKKSPEQVSAHVQAINEAAQTHPLFQRSPERFNDLVQKVAPEDQFYVNGEKAADVVNQLPEAARSALFNAVPDLQNQLETSSVTGADVAIRKADYTSFIAPHPQSAQLADWIKLDPADKSIGERNVQTEFMRQNPEMVSDIQNQVTQIPQDATQDEMSDAVKRIVRKSMVDAGIPAHEARMQASLYAKTMTRFAQPFGQNAIDAINHNMLEFHSVDEQGTPVQKGSNFSVLLNDLQKVRAGKSIPGGDENTVAAVNRFGDRLEAAGLAPEQAARMSSRELLDAIYKQKTPVEQATDAVKTFTQNLMQGKLTNPLEAAPVDETPNTLRQTYPMSERSRATDENASWNKTPYNGTKSPEFQEWFGKSKVTDDKGEPLTVYHGSHGDFDQFRTGRHEKDSGGIFFADKPETASMYSGYDNVFPSKKIGSVYPVYLRVENLKTVDFKGDKYGRPEAIAQAKLEGYDGILLKNHYDAGGVGNQYVVFDPNQIKSVFNSGQFSKIDPNILKQEERGYITFNRSDNFAERLKHVVVAFTASKNFSTGAHEFAHWAVAQHRMFAELARENVSAGGEINPEIQRISDDWQKLKEFVGADNDRFTVDQEEKAARAFEAYMREGHAPSEDLRRIFTRFRDWLVKIYKDLKSLNVEINPEIRGVFDRWLASEEQIAQVRSKNGALAEIAQKLGLSDDIVARVADYVNSATAHAEEKVYRELSQEQKKRETKAYRDELAAMTEKVKTELGQKREYNLINYLKENNFKLLEGPETEGIDPSILTDKPNEENAVHPDAVSELYGYDSGMDMLRALKATRPIDEAATSEARNRLLDKFPDMVAQGRIHNEAVEAIMNDRVLIALDLMIKELGRSKGAKTTVGMKKFAIAMAQQQVEQMKLSNVNYSFRFDAARDTELKNALQASRKGDSNNAMLHLQRSMVNQIIYRSLEDFKDTKAKADKLFDKVDRDDRDLAPTKDIDFIGAARYILNKYGLGGQEFDIQKWMADIQERDPTALQDLIMLSDMVAAPPKPSGDLTIAEFRDIYNSIQNIYQISRSMKEGEIAGKKFAVDQAVGELNAQMGPPTKPLHNGTQLTAGNKFRNGVSSAKAALRRVEEWTRAMDGGDNGPFQKYIFRPAREAQTRYQIDREKSLGGYRDILKNHAELLKENTPIDTQMIKNDSLGRQSRLTFRNRMEMIGFMLHTGNESNLDKLLGGYGIDRDQYQAEMDRLESTGIIGREDRQLVQELWDHVEDLKPLMQATHKKLYGFRFDEIENAPIKTRYGVYRGGYWPAMIDRDQAANNKSVEDQINENRQYLLPTTGKGFTKNRAQGYRQPLNTDLRLGSQHIDKVLRFIHLEPAVRDISRVVNRVEFKDLLKAHDFDAMDGMLMPWLGRFATQTMEAPPSGNRFERMTAQFLNAIRSSAMSQIIGYNAKVALQNVANMGVAAHRVGDGNIASGTLKLAKSFASVSVNPVGSIRDMKTASPFMNARLSTNALKVSQEINQIVEGKWAASKGRDFLNRHSMIFMHAMDGYLGAITWHASYSDAIAGGKTDADAIYHADQIARQVMGSNDPVDISQFEGGNHPFVKLFTPFMSYFNAQANLVGTEFGNITRKYGWSGSPRLFMAYIALVAAPAVIGDLIYGSLQNDLPSDQDDDGQPLQDWMAWAAQSQVKYLSAFVPMGGPIVSAAMNTFKGKQPDDRISLSPVISSTTSLYKTGQEMFGDGEVQDGRLIRDIMSAFGFITRIPLGQIAKPISYAVDVNEGNQEPDGPINYMKGLIAGPPPKQK